MIRYVMLLAPLALPVTCSAPLYHDHHSTISCAITFSPVRITIAGGICPVTFMATIHLIMYR